MKLEATYKRAIHVWWAFLWRSIIASILGSIIAAILGGIVGVIMGLMGFSPTAISVFSFILGFVIGLAISVVPVKLIIDKNYGEFELVLQSNADASQNLARDWSRIIKVWWAYLWRNFLLIIGWWILVTIVTNIIVGTMRAIGVTGVTYNVIGILLLIVVILLSLALSVIPVKLVLNKDFGEFTLALSPVDKSLANVNQT
jgi:ABC-type amino acid transport system permease subunit